MDEMLDTAPCGFLLLSDDGIILQINTTLREWLGYPVGALTGKSLETVLPVAARIFHQTYVSPILKLEGKVSEIYLSLRPLQGDDLPVLVNALRRQRAEAAVNEYVILPIRQRSEMESELLRAKRAAEEANLKKENALLALEKALADLELQKAALESMNLRLSQAMTETHHRVKNNLQLISTLIDIQKDTDRTTIPMEELVRLGANVRALGVIHDILTREARAGADQETLSARTVLETLIATIQLTTGNRRLVTTLADGRLYGKQATSLALVVNELIANALKHGTGEVEILFTVKDNDAYLEIGDDGHGFPLDFDVATSANIGLEIVGNIVTWDLEGSIEYKNADSGGARVVVTFPIH